MKIYLGFTVAGSRSSIEAAKKILDVLQLLGHEVLTSHLVRDDAWEADRSVAPQKIFARDMNWLAQCDLFVAEVTGSSFGLGFETGYLLGATAKKTILFFERATEHGISLPNHREHAPKLRTGAIHRSPGIGRIGSEARVRSGIARSEQRHVAAQKISQAD
jgi:nucleoside 2-deoxyribosyltransferase